jgi:hypothetical protein
MNNLVPKISDNAIDIDVSYDAKKMSAPPSIAQAVGELTRSIDLNTYDDVILEYSKDRYGQIVARFRAYRNFNNRK